MGMHPAMWTVLGSTGLLFLPDFNQGEKTL